MSYSGQAARADSSVNLSRPSRSSDEISPNGVVKDGTPRQPMTEEEQAEVVRQLRSEAVARYRPIFREAASPIRAMARMVREVEASALKAGISRQVIDREIVNRSIGDVNVRLITEQIDGVDYSAIGEDLGLILPGEQIGGRTSTGATHTELDRREEVIERRLLRDYNCDLRIYDVLGVGNPLLREML